MVLVSNGGGGRLRFGGTRGGGGRRVSWSRRGWILTREFQEKLAGPREKVLTDSIFKRAAGGDP